MSNTFGTVNLGASGSAGAMHFYAPNSFHNVNIISGNVYIYDSGAMGGSSGTITLPGPGGRLITAAPAHLPSPTPLSSATHNTPG